MLIPFVHCSLTCSLHFLYTSIQVHDKSSVSKLFYEEEIEDEVLPMMNEENYLFVAKES